MKVWVLTREENQYDQYGEYFETVWAKQPTAQQIEKYLNCHETLAKHIAAGGGPLWQNNRCSRVFKTINGAYDIDGKVFVDKQGSAYTNINSRTIVTFPYTPTTEYVYE